MADRRKHKYPATATSALLAAYDGRQCIGHLINRGCDVWEAFDIDDSAIGVFARQRTPLTR